MGVNDNRQHQQGSYTIKRKTPSFVPLAPAPVIQHKREECGTGDSQMIILDSPVNGIVQTVKGLTYDRVKQGDVLFVIEDKDAQCQVIAPADGIIGPLIVAEQSEIRIGDVLCTIHERVRF